MNARSLRFAAQSVVLVLAIAACSDGGNGEAGDSATKEIAIAGGGEPAGLDPQLHEDNDARVVTDSIYDTLLQRETSGEIVPWLAMDAPTQVDDTTWQFEIREGVEFTNGEALDAEAVAASVERVIDPDFGSEQFANFSTITGAEAVGSHTVNILTNGPDAILPARMTMLAIVPPELAQDPDANLDAEPVGSGPYRFVEWVRGDHITIEANADFWGEAPPIDRVRVQFIEERTTRLASLVAGEVDLFKGLAPEDEGQAPKSVSRTSVETYNIPFWVDSQSDVEGITGNEQFRQALNYAVDKQAMIDQLFGGRAKIDPCQMIIPEATGYNPDLEPYPYDPDRARELLAEAGAEGASIELLGTNGLWLKDREVVEAVAGYWTEVGVDVELTVAELSEFGERLFGIKDVRPQSYLAGVGNELFDADRQLSAIYHEEGGPAMTFDDDLTARIEEARTITDEAERQATYEAMTEEICDRALSLFLFQVEDIYGLSERLQFEPRADGRLFYKDMDVSE